MEFTYAGIENLLSDLKKSGYTICDYADIDNGGKIAILRHDVDYCLEKTLRIAEIEKDMGVRSTFFLMLTSEFYNLLSRDGEEIIAKIIENGHDIGLHFDEVRYPNIMGKVDEISEKIIWEANLLSEITGSPVTKVSMHRPSKEIIRANLEIPGIINTYGDKYFENCKYLSDSRRCWREPVEDIIKNSEYDKLQILIHCVWYNENELSLKESVKSFVKSANLSRYNLLNKNFTNLSDVMIESEVL